jgi:hypothetical protein
MEHPERPCRILETFEVPGDSVTGAIQLYLQEMDLEYDYLARLPDAERYLPGIRNTTYVKRKPWTPPPPPPPPKLDDDVIMEEEEGDEEEGEEEDQEFIPKGQQLPNKELYLSTTNNLGAEASSRLPTWKDGKTLIDWSSYPFNDAPRIHYRNVFFCGTSRGNGLIIELLSTFNPIDNQVVGLVS